MRSFRLIATRLVWVLAIALLGVRMADAHLHLCFDGLDPPSSLHVGESAPDHEDAHGDEHRDTDVSVDLLVLLKAGKLDPDDLLPALLGAVFLGLLIAPERGVPPRRALVPAFVPAPRLRPPLRGPPR